MTRILDELVVRLNPQGTGWRLAETLEYRVGSADSTEVVEVDVGFPVRLNPQGTGWSLAETLEYRVGSADSTEVVEVDVGFPVRLNPQGTGWSLAETLEYRVGSADSTEVVEVDVGFPTDFASIPAPARALMSTWKKTARAAVIHDFLYHADGRAKYGYSKRQADLIFLEVLGVMDHRVRLAAWAAVRTLGRTHWEQDGSGGVSGSKVTRLTNSQYVWVFVWGLLSVLAGATLFNGFAAVTTSVSWGSLASGLGAAGGLGVVLQLVLALLGGLTWVIVGSMFLLAGALELLSRDTEG